MYTGKLIDAMSQIEYYIPFVEINRYLELAGVDKIAIFPRNKMSANEQGHNSLNHHLFNLSKWTKDKIIVGSPKKFDQRVNLNDKFVDSTIKSINIYKFIGELMLTHADKEDGAVNETGERYVNPLSSNVIRLLDTIKKDPIPVMFHWETYHWDRDWMNISSMLSMYPEIIFIWPHCGFSSPAKIDAVLVKHPNVIPTLSKRELFRRGNLWLDRHGDHTGAWSMINQEWQSRVDSACTDDTGKILPEWVDLLNKYPDKFMFATDAHKLIRWKCYTKIAAEWRNILGQLPVELAEKIAYSNAERVYNIS
jgi:hypothetical protein